MIDNVISKADKIIEKMVNKYQCPGCACGSDTKTCNSFSYQPTTRPGTASGKCLSHVTGTSLGLKKIALGFPTGFNRVGNNKIDIELFEKKPDNWNGVFNVFQVPVWAAEHEGDLIIRMFGPRIDSTWLMVIRGMKFDELPKTLSMKGIVGIDEEVPFNVLNVTELMKHMD